MNLVRRDRAALGAAFSFALAMLALAAVRAQEKANNDAKQKAQEPAELTIALDPTFGNGGFVADLLDAKTQTGALGRFLAVDRQGRPMIAGNSPGQRFAVGRYTQQGRPDTTVAGKG